MKFIVIIPARFSSTRFPGKPLVNINNKPMIIHVMERAIESGANQVIVATDHINIFNIVQEAGGNACLTSSQHQSGTERIWEVIKKYKFNNEEIIVNLQGDEPFIPPTLISQIVTHLMNHSHIKMITLALSSRMNENDAFHPNIVKVVIDKNNYALYFSRSLIPWGNQISLNNYENTYEILQHIGIYAYRVNFIKRYIHWKMSPLEQIEKLEQLRVLWYGEKIYVKTTPILFKTGINDPKDL
ncbi:3-deoxy-manno-octulosonate cytidylyltransferase [Candidatus Schneideria nysicola]|uniref:3-deoxy-manno-octulosonate cytidylyltransferase n=1 Tax=Candidatus Schneideria nysicola TaxID=1081631 RepID=UPI001CAA7D8F|nr:3-deoxy-manno-octulosonate cytidylyltransferase [Candidatus Schneideria nysicola]UAJ66180.1 3-deoxy-manno-octulosonate cytidylyltransferase [Candidatus Schneideria nysicola]